MVASISLRFDQLIVDSPSSYENPFFWFFFLIFFLQKLVWGATISLSFDWCRFWFEFRKSGFRFSIFLSLLVKLEDANLKYKVFYTSDCCHTYELQSIVKKSTYSYSILCISAPRRVFTAYLSLWELLMLGNWIKDCRRYGPSFVLTTATIVDGDTSKYCTP